MHKVSDLKQTKCIYATQNWAIIGWESGLLPTKQVLHIKAVLTNVALNMIMN